MLSIYTSMVFPKKRFKNAGHHALVGGFGILKDERQYVVTIHPRWSYESCVCRVEGEHQDLIIARVCFKEG